MRSPKGRLLSLTKEVQEKIVECVRSGMHFKHAAAMAGISEKSFLTWMAKGRKKEHPYESFFLAVEKAKAEDIANNCKHINTAAITQWQAAAWMLERKYPEFYGRETWRIKQLEEELTQLRKLIEKALSPGQTTAPAQAPITKQEEEVEKTDGDAN